MTEDETSKVIEEDNKSGIWRACDRRRRNTGFWVIAIFFEDGQEAWVNDFLPG
ncbi:MAG: hypothetical protein ACOX25_09075 [Caldicoprobacterales bacterium]